MKEDILNKLRQQDVALRDAIRMEEQELPQMPADLNARVMKKLEQQKPVAKTRRLWPWVAAACVAGVMMIILTPPKDGSEGIVAQQKVATNVESQQKELNHGDCPHDTSEAMNQRDCPRDSQPRQIAAQHKKLQHKTVVAEQQKAEKAAIAEAVAAEVHKPADNQPQTASRQPETLTDSDIPITRPENYKYTPEEIALMKRQANEAYLKWVELELEIAKYNQEQTAQK
jgi:hypothetical protein